MIEDQPPPIPRVNVVGMHDLVIEDFKERKQVGFERYGSLLQPHNGRDGLVDLYQELMDACVYVRQLIEERDGPSPTG